MTYDILDGVRIMTSSMMRRAGPVAGTAAAALLVLGACAPGERLGGDPRGLPRPVPGTARDAHAVSLERAGHTAAAAAWDEASRRALRSGLFITPPFRERIHFPDDAAHAAAYRFFLQRGETLRVRIHDAQRSGVLFADIFEALTDDMFRHVHGAQRGAGEIVYRATHDGVHVLRLQPLFAAGGSFEVEAAGYPALLFPVADASPAAFGGWFGDPRDGGARAHEGIDIFAPRGTPVIAVAAGRIAAAQNTRTGGLVIWLADELRDLTYYYAHLDEQRVRRGQYVLAGDTIGTVGNTGNATGTRPHLHFGAYLPGTRPLDPLPLLAAAAQVGTPAGHDGQPHAPDEAVLGRWTQIQADRVRLRTSPSLAGSIIAELGASTSALVLGSVPGWYRVVLTDGTTGFVSARFTATGSTR